MSEQAATPELLYQSSKFVVVNKPGGVLTQGPPGIDSMEVRMRRWARSQAAILSNESVDSTPPTNASNTTQSFIGVPHRLDRPVSGAIVFALDKPTTQLLCRQFQDRNVGKRYWALVEGKSIPKNAQLSDYLRKIPGEARSETCDQDAEKAQYALLKYRVIQPVGNFTWVEIELETGRTHQIRLQFGSRGMPIIGDRLYGATTDFGEVDPDERKRPIALHARHLRVTDPESKKLLRIDAPLPSVWHEFAGLE